MFIFKSTGLRGPAYPDSTPYTAPDGTRHPRYPRELLEEIAEPVAPLDYSEETYFRNEQDAAPYVVYTRKSEDQLEELRKSKVEAKLKLVRDVREDILDRLVGIAFAAQLAGDAPTTAAYLVVRQALLDITTGVKDLPVAEVDATVIQRYAAIVPRCTPAMLSAFAQVDA